MVLMLSLPCTYENSTLTIRCLRISADGSSAEDALFKAIKNTPELYAELCSGRVVRDNKNRHELIVPHSEKLYNKIVEIEPSPESKKKAARKDGVLKASAEETLKYGY